MRACVSACVRACVRECVRACVCVCVSDNYNALYLSLCVASLSNKHTKKIQEWILFIAEFCGFAPESPALSKSTVEQLLQAQGPLVSDSLSEMKTTTTMS